MFSKGYRFRTPLYFYFSIITLGGERDKACALQMGKKENGCAGSYIPLRDKLHDCMTCGCK